MDPKIEKRVKALRKKIEKRLEKFFKAEIKKAGETDPVLKEAVSIIAEFTLRGGKRIRSILMHCGYLCSRKKESPAVLDVAICLELIHSFLLIHDDIIDNDLVRRGGPTVHEAYAKMFKELKYQTQYGKNKQKKLKDKKRNLDKINPDELGRSVAIICGDVAFALANKIICESQFKETIKIKALMHLQKAVLKTTAGEMLDIMGEVKKPLKTKDILTMYRLKTAEYTIETPLILGAILGEADAKVTKKLSQYAIYLGTAYQIQDDLLGIFGEKTEIGKEPGGDLREGKKTLIVLKTLEKSKPKDRAFIKKILGNPKLTKRELNQFRKIAIQSGAFDYCSGVANNLAFKSKEIILKCPIPGSCKNFLLGSADYLVERKS